MSDDVIPLNKIGKIGTVKVYNQAYVDKQQKRIEELTKWLSEASDEKLKLQMLRVDLVSKIGKQEKRTAELEKENAELKEKLLEQKQYTEFKCNEAVKKKEIYEREHFLLTKAKEIIKKFLEFVNNENEYDPEHPQEYTDLWNKLCEEAEQFINSEVEK